MTETTAQFGPITQANRDAFREIVLDDTSRPSEDGLTLQTMIDVLDDMGLAYSAQSGDRTVVTVPGIHLGGQTSDTLTVEFVDGDPVIEDADQLTRFTRAALWAWDNEGEWDRHLVQDNPRPY